MRHSFRKTIKICLLLAAMFFLLTHTDLVISGTHTGLELWYHSVLPSVFPFMILTSILRDSVTSDKLCYLGLLCGLPVGAGLVDRQLSEGILSIKKANTLLVICNITSPMFVCGYIWNQTFDQNVSLEYILILLYTPILIYTLIHFRILFLDPHKIQTTYKSFETAASDSLSAANHKVTHSSLEDILYHCIRIILMTGVYIMVFCIIIQILTKDTVRTWSSVMISGLEITNGIRILYGLPLSIQQKTALIMGLTSFGGICSIFQTKSTFTHSGLSLRHYIVVKLILSIGSILLGMLIPPF